MSVAGILDAMRSSRPFSERLVWQCLENHANGARFWRISIAGLAGELNMRTGTVSLAILALERDEIIRCDRRRKFVTTYHMMRTYPAGATDDAAETLIPEIGLQDEVLGTEIGLQEPPLIPENVPQPPILESENRTQNPPVSKNPPVRGSLRSQRAREEKADLPVPVDDDIPAAWNAMATAHGLSPIRFMTPARRRTLAVRISEVGRDGMLEAIANVGKSAHCHGANERGWRADFDFLLQPKSLIRAIEGRYSHTERRSKWDVLHDKIAGQGTFLAMTFDDEPARPAIQ